MVRHIRIPVDDETHEQLSERKNDLGLTWEGLLKRGARDLDDPDPVTDGDSA